MIRTKLNAPFGGNGDGFNKPWNNANSEGGSRPWENRSAGGNGFKPRSSGFGGGFGGNSSKPWERNNDNNGFKPRSNGGYAPSKPWERNNDNGGRSDYAPRRSFGENNRFTPATQQKPWERRPAGQGGFNNGGRPSFGGTQKPWERRPSAAEGAENGFSGSRPFGKPSGAASGGAKPFRLPAGRHGGKKRSSAAIPCDGEIIYGRQPVREVLRANRRPVKLLVLADGVKDSEEVADIRRICLERDITLEFYRREDLEAWVNGANHQGIIAFCEDYPYVELEELVSEIVNGPENSIVVVLDHIVDPQNLGAILRTCECAGVLGVVIPTDRAVGVTPAAVRASTGASEHVKVARVSNLVTALDHFKEAGVWISGLEALADSKPHTQVDFKGKVCIVVGSEAHGICSPVRKKCNFLVRLPMCGKINSLNASVATALAVYEVLRQQGVDQTLAPAGFIDEEVKSLRTAAERDAAEASEEAALASLNAKAEAAAEKRASNMVSVDLGVPGAVGDNMFESPVVDF